MSGGVGGEAAWSVPGNFYRLLVFLPFVFALAPDLSILVKWLLGKEVLAA